MAGEKELRAANLALAERVIRTCGDLRPEDVRDDLAEDAVLDEVQARIGAPVRLKAVESA